jgi:carbonic anhydrase
MRNDAASNHTVSRRRLLQLGLTGTAATLVSGVLPFTFSSLAFAQDASTPEGALAELMAGNKRYVSGHTSSHNDLSGLRAKTAGKQTPFAAVLACADSRVPVELIFDQSIGQIFTARVAGNIATAEILGSLEYGAAVLGTKVIMVLGHGACGAVHATMEAKAVPGQISSLFPHIQPAVDEAGEDLTAAIKANAKIQAKLISESSTVIAPMVKDGKVKVVAGYYDLASGVVTQL